MAPKLILPATALLVVAAAQPIPASQLFSQVNIPSARCNKGDYSMYYRNCSANWDRKPGDPDFCALEVETWIIHFAEDVASDVDASSQSLHGPYCYDSKSCASRPENLTSLDEYSSTAFFDGIMLPFAEANPNLYKAHSIVAPSCSSDLLAGNGTTQSVGGETWSFSGAGIVDAVLQAAFTGLPQPDTLATADRVILSGGAGVMARIDSLATALVGMKRRATGNASAQLDVLGLCDGCLLFDVSPPFIPSPSCQTDVDCPPSVGLPRLATWAGLVRPEWCTTQVAQDVWQCYSAQVLLPALHKADTPVLIFQQQYDAVQLASYGVYASPSNASAGQAWAEAVFAPTVRAALAGVHYAVAPACGTPSSIALSSAWYHTLTRHVDPYGHVHNDSMNTATPEFVEDAVPGGFGPSTFGVWGDDCQHQQGCNPSACAV